ncbi:MAG: hypothetical protein QOE36_575 [Gaiellaceae bacterium]|nr:hypothetical protein [Gaiellaceae bacterium]
MLKGAAATLRVTLVAGLVCAAGLAVASAAAYELVRGSHDASRLAGLALMFAAAALAERYPVPADRLDVSGVSLAFVFGVAGVQLFGWPGTVLVVAAAAAVVQLGARRPSLRVAYNASMHALAVGAGAMAIAPIDTGGAGGLLAAVVLCGLVQHAVNMLLVSTVVSASAQRPFLRHLADSYRSSAFAFGLMTSAAVVLVVLWQRSPALSAALLGPLLAIALYQRAAIETLRAIRLSLTDPLTGLGNHRHFHERLRRELERADDRGAPLSLCLVDVDDFKRVNDRLGHQEGDRVLADVASRLRQGGEAFRLGGDEFALLLPRHDEAEALAAAEAVVARLSGLDIEQAEHVTVSAGAATVAGAGGARDDLVRRADAALYWAKAHGKNRACAADAGPPGTEDATEETSEFQTVATVV